MRRAMERTGLVPVGSGRASCVKRRLVLVPARIDEIERTVQKHGVIAFLTHVEELAGLDARWLHRGMTSSDVLDASLAILLRRLRGAAAREGRPSPGRARPPSPRAGQDADDRSQPRRSSPSRSRWGSALAGHHAEIARGSRSPLAGPKEEIAVGKIAGAVGTYAHLISARSRPTALACAGALGRDGVHPGCRARPPRRVLRGARSPRRSHREARDQRPSLATLRGGRSRRGVHRRPEGVERDASQAQSHLEREPLRPRANRSRGGRACSGKRRAVA